MGQKKTYTQQMIKRLQEIGPNLTEAEAELARYQIERLRDANPFLSGTDAKPHTVLECWTARDTNRSKILAGRLAQERSLLKGYKVIQAAEDSPEIQQSIALAQKKIYFMQTEISRIDGFIEDASEQQGSTVRGSIFVGRPKEEKMTKRRGVANMTITELVDKNPLNKNLNLLFYADDSLAISIPQSSIGTSRAVSIPFESAARLELLLETPSEELVGWLTFPIEDLIEAEDRGTKTFYYRIADKSILSISFGKCELEKKKIRRMNVDLVTTRVANHVMRRMDTVMYYYCSVCEGESVSDSESVYYRCDLCKFTCHLRCAHNIFFECLEYLSKKEEEDEKARLEEKLLEIRKEKLRMIVAAVDIREKVPEGHTSAERIRKPLNLSPEPKEPTVTMHRKKYNVPHQLEKQKNLGISWCSHCGERIGILTPSLECHVCSLDFHLECKNRLFKSCGITPALRSDLILYVPTAPKQEEPTVSLREFTLVSVLGKGTFGMVFLAQWKGQSVAIKAIKKIDLIETNSPGLVDVERRCLEIAQSSKNLLLVRLLECFQSQEYIFLVTEFVSGGDLYYHTYHSALPPEYVKLVLAEIVLAIEFLHSNNIIYRDLKLENILIDREGHIKLGDFGLCSIGAKNGVARTFCGSIESIAPEVIDGKYTKCADWWGLGVIAYEIALQRLPFQGETPKRVYESIQSDPPENLATIDGPLQQLIQQLLEKDPKARLGAGSVREIKEHQYFEGVNWEDVRARSVTMPWTPQAADLKNFDDSFTNEKPTLPAAKPINPSEEKYFQNFQYGV